MKLKSQLEVLKSIRKPQPPPTRVEQPVKGAPYKRPSKNWQKWED